MRALQFVRRLRRQQQMVDAYAEIFRPCAGLIIPECIGFIRIIAGPQGIGKAQIEQALKAGAGLRQKQSVIGPDLRVITITRLRNDIIIPSQNKRLLQCQQTFGMGLQMRHPA